MLRFGLKQTGRPPTNQPTPPNLSIKPSAAGELLAAPACPVALFWFSPSSAPPPRAPRYPTERGGKKQSLGHGTRPPSRHRARGGAQVAPRPLEPPHAVSVSFTVFLFLLGFRHVCFYLWSGAIFGNLVLDDVCVSSKRRPNPRGRHNKTAAPLLAGGAGASRPSPLPLSRLPCPRPGRRRTAARWPAWLMLSFSPFSLV